MRRWLVGVSLVVHVGIIFGLFVAGAWRIDRLDPAKHRIDLAVQLPPPPAREGGPQLPAQKITPKTQRVVVHETVQPEVVPVEAPKPAEPTDVPGTGGSGEGPGSGSGHDDIDGPCMTGCGPGSAAPQKATPVVVEREPETVPPAILRGLRISGETQIQPNELTKQAMQRDGKTQVKAMVKVCIDTAGRVRSAAQLRSSGYPAYDGDLLAAIGGWRYRPYAMGAAAIPVCGVVTFVYGIE